MLENLALIKKKIPALKKNSLFRVKPEKPKCLARHVTLSCKFMSPLVTPSMACSLVCAVDIWCKSMLRDKSKQTSIGASISVFNTILGIKNEV